MKSIITKVLHGKATATDGDGNRITISTTDLQYEDGHRAAVLALCQKMNWTGTLQGGGRMLAGRSDGMVWVWLDANRQITI